MRLLRIPELFNHSDFIFEPKLDGFRALTHIRGHHCTLVSRNGHVFKSWPQLAEEIAHAVRAHSAILEGEICCLNPDGTSDFNRLLFRRDWPHFYAFDVLSINGRDLTGLPLHKRKIKVGLEADLVILVANPLTGLDALKDIRVIVNDGEVAFRNPS